MRSRFLIKSAMKAALISTLILLGGCETPIPDACAWVKPISPNPGFDKRWTRDEKEQIDTLDKLIDLNCGKGL